MAGEKDTKRKEEGWLAGPDAGAGRLPPQAAPKQSALSGSHYKPPPLVEVLTHEHLDYYRDEFTFRFNRRTSRHRGKLFFRLVQQAVQTEPFPYDHLIRGVPEGRSRKHNV
jgi:hypothetical protein